MTLIAINDKATLEGRVDEITVSDMTDEVLVTFTTAGNQRYIAVMHRKHFGAAVESVTRVPITWSVQVVGTLDATTEGRIIADEMHFTNVALDKNSEDDTQDTRDEDQPVHADSLKAETLND